MVFIGTAVAGVVCSIPLPPPQYTGAIKSRGVQPLVKDFNELAEKEF